MKTRDLHLKITEEEYQRIRTAAFAEGISIGEYVRRTLAKRQGNQPLERA